MTPAKLAQIVEQLGGKHVSRVVVETLSGERFELMQIMSGAPVSLRVELGDGGATTIRSFRRVVDGVELTVEHRRPANVVELRSAL